MSGFFVEVHTKVYTKPELFHGTGELFTDSLGIYFGYTRGPKSKKVG